MPFIPGGTSEKQYWRSTPSTNNFPTITTVGKTYFGSIDSEFDAVFPPNFFANSRTIRWDLRGIYTMPTLNTATLNTGLDVVIATTPTATITTISQCGSFLPAVATDKSWLLDLTANTDDGAKMTKLCSTIANGYYGLSAVNLGSALNTANFAPVALTAPMGVDTTKQITFRPWAQWSGTITGTCAFTLQMFNVFCSE